MKERILRKEVIKRDERDSNITDGLKDKINPAGGQPLVSVHPCAFRPCRHKLIKSKSCLY